MTKEEFDFYVKVVRERREIHRRYQGVPIVIPREDKPKLYGLLVEARPAGVIMTSIRASQFRRPPKVAEWPSIFVPYSTIDHLELSCPEFEILLAILSPSDESGGA